MRILWIKVGGLWPLNTGGRLRSFHILSELSRRHRVTVLTTHRPGEDPERLREQLPWCERVDSFPHAAPKWHSPRFPATLLRSWFSSLPVDLWKCRVSALRNEVDRIVATQAVDLCVADFISAVPNVPFTGAVPVVFFAHNVEHMIWKRLSRNTDSAWRRVLLEIEWQKMRRCEIQACRRASLTVAVSAPDRDLLAADTPDANICVVPTGVDIGYFTPHRDTEIPNHLVYTGSMDWYPNEDAIFYFIDAILPMIRHQVPGTTLTVAGRNPSQRLRHAAVKAGVEITGTVDDVRPPMAQAAVYVVPLRIGGGTRLKIFEALAMGKAVVSTTVGAEGLPITPSMHFLQADEPAAFAAAVVSLLRDPAHRRALGMAGRQLVEEHYSWKKIAMEFEARCNEAVSKKVPEQCFA